MSNLIIVSNQLSELEKLKANSPQVVSKLQFWAGKRYQSRYNSHRDFVSDAFIAKEVDAYLEAIAFSTNTNDLLENVRRFQHLSLQEKSIVGKFFPFNLPDNRTKKELDWFCQSHWYKIGDGSYTTAFEEVVSGITYQGKDVAIITRNAYEADVLNAPNMMIVDVDLESDTYTPVVYSESFALGVLQAFVESYGGNIGFRAYKTAAGLRYICTTHEFNPCFLGTDHQPNPSVLSSNRIMKSLFADDRYRALCLFQETYRARLTPKPWRAWHDDRDYAVCRLVGIYGNSKILPQFKASIKYHDKVTGASSSKNLPLA